MSVVDQRKINCTGKTTTRRRIESHLQPFIDANVKAIEVVNAIKNNLTIIEESIELHTANMHTYDENIKDHDYLRNLNSTVAPVEHVCNILSTANEFDDTTLASLQIVYDSIKNSIDERNNVQHILAHATQSYDDFLESFNGDIEMCENEIYVLKQVALILNKMVSPIERVFSIINSADSLNESVRSAIYDVYDSITNNIVERDVIMAEFNQIKRERQVCVNHKNSALEKYYMMQNQLYNAMMDCTKTTGVLNLAYSELDGVVDCHGTKCAGRCSCNDEYIRHMCVVSKSIIRKAFEFEHTLSLLGAQNNRLSPDVVGMIIDMAY